MSQGSSTRGPPTEDFSQDVGQKRVKAKRTSQACDRCRQRKNKCDGLNPCEDCERSQRTCVYSFQRRRDPRKWYSGMQEVTDEALQRLYRASKAANAFPGVLPGESEGAVTIEAILRGLGLPTESAQAIKNAAPPASKLSPLSEPIKTESERASLKKFDKTQLDIEVRAPTSESEVHISCGNDSSESKTKRRKSSLRGPPLQIDQLEVDDLDMDGQFHKAVVAAHVQSGKNHVAPPIPQRFGTHQQVNLSRIESPEMTMSLQQSVRQDAVDKPLPYPYSLHDRRGSVPSFPHFDAELDQQGCQTSFDLPGYVAPSTDVMLTAEMDLHMAVSELLQSYKLGTYCRSF